MTFATSQRDQMLDALVAVLRGLEGVRYVDRQAITRELVTDAQMPAIIIEEVGTNYRWIERHGDRKMRVRSGIVIDLQARARRRKDGPGGNVSTARENFVRAVLNHLANNPMLQTQLAGEDESTPHAYDTSHLFDVRYVREADPFVRALITIQVDTDDVFDSRTRTDWQQLILNTTANPEISDGPVTTTHEL